MSGDIRNKQLAAHMAYYDRALRTLLEMIEGTGALMKADGLTEVAVWLGKASLEIERARATLMRDHASSMVAHLEHGEPGGTEGHVE
jgi:hypothetical protein